MLVIMKNSDSNMVIITKESIEKLVPLLTVFKSPLLDMDLSVERRLRATIPHWPEVVV